MHRLGEALRPGSRGHAQLHRTRAQGSAVTADKYALDTRAHERGALREPDPQRCNRLGADRTDALFAALAQYAHAGAGKVQIP